MFFSSPGLIPPAILARGTKAKEAYRRALEHGKTCDIRVRVMLIGQDHVGKTSVKRSLKGDKFNKHEASTAGVQMDPPLLRVGVRAWKPESQCDEPPTTMFDHKSAQLVARQLSGSSDELVQSPKRSSGSDVLDEFSAGKHSLSDGVHGTGDNFDFKGRCHSQSSVPSSGEGSSQNSPLFQHMDCK